MLDELAILATAAALIGALQAANRSTTIWTALSVAASGAVTTLIVAIGGTAVLPYAPVLAVLTAAICAGISTRLIAHHRAALDTSLLPAIGLLAGSWSWMLFTETPGAWSGFGSSFVAGAACGLFMLAGAALRASRLRNAGIASISLTLSIVLLALSALG